MRIEYVGDTVDSVTFVELGADAIMIGREWHPSQSVAYADIALVRLRFTPMSKMPDLFTCTLEARRGGRPLMFGSLSYVSLLKGYEPVAYRALITELHERILRAGGCPQFVAGDTTGGFALRVVGTLIGVCALIGILANKDGKLQGWTFAAAAAFIGWLIWLMIQYVRRSVPRHYSPHATPDNVLPTRGQDPS